MREIGKVEPRSVDESKPNYFSLSRECSLKLLEYPSVYNRKTGELYKLNEKSLDFIKDNQNFPAERAEENAFFKYLVEQGIYEPRGEPVNERKFDLIQAPSPSLRYLLVHLTSDYNLKCRHCYLGGAHGLQELRGP